MALQKAINTAIAESGCALKCTHSPVNEDRLYIFFTVWGHEFRIELSGLEILQNNTEEQLVNLIKDRIRDVTVIKVDKWS